MILPHLPRYAHLAPMAKPQGLGSVLKRIGRCLSRPLVSAASIVGQAVSDSWADYKMMRRETTLCFDDCLLEIQKMASIIRDVLSLRTYLSDSSRLAEWLDGRHEKKEMRAFEKLLGQKQPRISIEQSINRLRNWGNRNEGVVEGFRFVSTMAATVAIIPNIINSPKVHVGGGMPSPYSRQAQTFIGGPRLLQITPVLPIPAQSVSAQASPAPSFK